MEAFTCPWCEVKPQPVVSPLVLVETLRSPWYGRGHEELPDGRIWQSVCSLCGYRELYTADDMLRWNLMLRRKLRERNE